MISVKYIFAAIVLLYTHAIHAQIVAVTVKGDSILVNPDGTWSQLTTTKAALALEEITATLKVDKKDSFTNTRIRTTESWAYFANNSLIASATRSNNKFVFHFITKNVGCLEKLKSKVLVQLENGEIVELTQMSDTHCGTIPSASFIPISVEGLESQDYKTLINRNLYMLAMNKWTTLRIYGSEGFVEFSASELTNHNWSQFFEEHLLVLGYGN